MISPESNSHSLMIFDMILEGIVHTLHSPLFHIRVIVKKFDLDNKKKKE